MIGTLLRSAVPGLLSAGSLRGFVAAFNHLLTQHPNATVRLAAHAERRVRIGVDAAQLPPLVPRPEIWAVIRPDGLLRACERGEADVELLVKPSLAAGQALATEGVGALAAHMRVEGDVLLAGLLGEIIQELRWDYEDDLSRVVGDPAARRMGEAVRAGSETAGYWFGRARQQASSVMREATSRDGAATVARRAYESTRTSLDQLDQRLGELERKFRNR